MNKGKGGINLKIKYIDEIFKLIKKDFWIFLCAILFLTVGISIGAIGAKILDFSEKKSLILFMNNYFQIMDKSSLNTVSIFYDSVKKNFQPVFFIWLLSITPVGIPIILFILSFWGFVVGFTVAFLLEGMGVKGLVFTLIGVLPQNIIYIPCLVFLSCIGIKFSLNLIKKYLNRKSLYNYGNNLTNHTIYYLIAFIIMNVGAIFEVYFSPVVIKAISNYFVIK